MTSNIFFKVLLTRIDNHKTTPYPKENFYKKIKGALVLKKICCVFIISLIAILWPSYGNCMEEEATDSEPTRITMTRVEPETTTTTTAPQKTKCNTSTVRLRRKEWPRHFRLLIVKFGGDRHVHSLPRNERLVEERTQYQNAFKYYARALAAYNLNSQDTLAIETLKERKQIFQIAQRNALLKHGSLKTIEKVKHTPEGTDLSIDFKDAIENMEEVMFPFKFTTNPYDCTILKKRPQSESTVECTKQTIRCYGLNPEELESATKQLETLLFWLKREHRIQRSIWAFYYKYYFIENKNWTSLEQWGNYLTDAKREPTLNAIQTHIEENYPYGEYKLRLIKNPTQEFLDNIGSRELGIYLHEDKVFFKVRNQKEKRIPHNVQYPFGLRPTRLERLITVLTATEEMTLNIEDQWRLLEIASVCNYLPKDCSGEQTLRRKKERKEVLDILRNKPIWNWVLEGDQWTKILKEGTASPQSVPLAEQITATALEELDQLYSNLPKEGSDPSQASLPPKGWTMIETGWAALQYSPEEGWSKNREAVEREAFEDKLQNMFFRALPYNFIYPHRKDMILVLQELHKTQEVNWQKQTSLQNEKWDTSQEYSKKSLEKYKKLYNELENCLNTHIDQQFVLHTPHSQYSRIPECGAFYQAEHYATQMPIQELNLTHCDLIKGNFFAPNVYGIHQDKTIKAQPLLHKFRFIDLSNNNISDFTGLPTLSSNLESLSIHHNVLTHLDNVRYASNIQFLDISVNKIKELSFLRNCTSLTSLNFSQNLVGSKKHPSVDPLDTLTLLTNLTTLDISHNNVKTLTALKSLPLLAVLKANNNQLTGDWKPIFPFGLQNLCLLNVAGNSSLTFDDSFTKDALGTCFPLLKSLKTDQEEFSWH